MNLPKVSVILSTHNQGQYLPLAIKSILNQSFTNFEFLIIDDASSDRTSSILNRFKDKRIKTFTNQYRQGLTLSLNKVLRHSKGDYLARMDADDIAHPDRFKLQLKFLAHHPQVAVCGTAANLIDDSGKKIGERHYPLHITQTLLMRYNPLIHPSVMIRRTALDQLDNYDETLNGAEDYDLWLRLGSKYQLANINQVLLAYRINPRGISWSSLKHIELQAIKARFKALTSYNYPLWQSIFLIKPILSHMIPVRVKKLLFNIK